MMTRLYSVLLFGIEQQGLLSIDGCHCWSLSDSCQLWPTKDSSLSADRLASFPRFPLMDLFDQNRTCVPCSEPPKGFTNTLNTHPNTIIHIYTHSCCHFSLVPSLCSASINFPSSAQRGCPYCAFVPCMCVCLCKYQPRVCSLFSAFLMLIWAAQHLCW